MGAWSIRHLALFFAIASSSSAREGGGNNRIVGGVEADNADFPYHVNTKKNQLCFARKCTSLNDGNKNQAGLVVVDGDSFVVDACSGAIVAERTVLTTALCCDGAGEENTFCCGHLRN